MFVEEGSDAIVDTGEPLFESDIRARLDDAGIPDG
jgi:hypothetical protein